MGIKRFCYICQTEIFECMGSVHAGDFVNFLNGEQNTVRELCPLCVTFYANTLTDNSKNLDYPGTSEFHQKKLWY